MSEEAASPGGAASDVASSIERYHDLAVRMQNPVYLWLALEAMLAPVVGPQIDKPQGDVTIPAWLATYLHDAASRLNCLASGVDFRKEPPPFDFSLFEGEDGTINRDEAMRSPEWQQHMQAIAIDHHKAMQSVPAALGLVEDRRNQFERFLSATNNMQEVQFYDAAIKAGAASKTTLDAIKTGSAGRGKSDSQILARIRDTRRRLL